MFFLLPIRTSIRPYRTPYANYALIILNFIIFLLSWIPMAAKDQSNLRAWIDIFMLVPARPHLWQFITYAFLHSGFWHIFFNMYFLWIFGRNVNDKLGNLGYVTLYLAGAVCSGIGHSLLSSNPVLGASGAVAAVTGAYFALFPNTLITVFYMFFYIWDTVEIRALYLVGIKLIVWDNLIERAMPNVAYDAHLSGYAFGILSMLLLLALGLISSAHSDLWFMLKHYNRRRQYRDVVAGGYDPYGANRVKKIKGRQVKKQTINKELEKRIQSLRGEISKRMAQRNTSAAAQLYLELIDLDSEQLLSRQHLLDIANQLTSENRYAEAAQAYEKFIANYSSYEYIEQVKLMLGILYARYLQKPDLAIKYLESAQQKLSNPDQLKMCEDELSRLKT
ncbi:MAG: rhomboid family intramembrane serine protease [Sedimentisphaerales bacterium]|nr:rhomboid family intramembrane serine protease [Sedimentisphaerales bacterium]